MNIEFIEQKFDEIFKELEKEVLEVLENQSFDKKNTNLKMKPLVTTKQILQNALESIKMVNDLEQKDNRN
jgi:transcriptional/translational regulatory protein YebC/TACO1